MTSFKHYSNIDLKGNEGYVTLASGPVIIEEGKVLLDKHGSDEFWKFPGGTLDGRYNLFENASKEVRDELGLEIELIEVQPCVLAFVREYKGKTENVILFHYLAKRKGEPKSGRDVREYTWADVKNLPTDCAPNIKPVIDYFLKDITKRT